jgi:hypothetical protein
METRTCKECSKPFEGKSHKQYCSSTCRSIASNKRTYGGMGNTPTPPAERPRPAMALTTPAPTVTDPASAFIISELTRKRDKLDKQLEVEIKKNEDLKAKLEETQKAFDKFKSDKQIEEISNAKPGGLSGFLESSAGQKLLEVAGPTLVEKFASLLAPAPTQIAGTEGTPAATFIDWWGTLPVDLQHKVWSMLQAISVMPHAELGNYCMEVAKQVMAAFPQQQQQAV